ncbi:MAG: ribosomal RNA small subunit methyltransferase A [bacterium]|nr:ribosomal RNA small subunit methyltransferase A [bacterium]
MSSPSLKKHLGQHHLREGRLCRPLLEWLAPQGQRVVEIGPGGGVLTAELIAAQARVIACEVDPQWAFFLRRRLPGAVRILVLDALHLDWRRLPSPTLVAGNLPFQVATPIIESLLAHAGTVPRAGFMVQKEVADRLVARPGERAYGSLSVLVAAQARAKYLRTVRPGSFHPPPGVTAAFVGIELRSPPLPPAEMPAFARLVRSAFARRRKTLRNSLAAQWGRELSEEILRSVGLERSCRAEALELGAFVEMYRAWRRLVETWPEPPVSPRGEAIS